MRTKGQTTIELLILLTISVLALVLVYSLYAEQVNSGNFQREQFSAKNSLQKIVNSANKLVLSGAGSQTEIDVEFFEGTRLDETIISGNTILIVLSNGSEIVGIADANFSGNLRDLRGKHKINLYYDGNSVLIFYKDFEINQQSISFSIIAGLDQNEKLIIRNSYSTDLNFFIENNFSHSLVSLSTSPDYNFTILAGDFKEIDLEFLIDDSANGNYSGNLKIISTLDDINIEKVVNISVEVLQEFSPILISPNNSSFTANPNSIVTKSISLCNKTLSNISGVSFSSEGSSDANLAEWFDLPDFSEIPKNECVVFDVNFEIPTDAEIKDYDANLIANVSGLEVVARFTATIIPNASQYFEFQSVIDDTLFANYDESYFIKQNNLGYFIPTGELDWNKGSYIENYYSDVNLYSLFDMSGNSELLDNSTIASNGYCGNDAREWVSGTEYIDFNNNVLNNTNQTIAFWYYNSDLDRAALFGQALGLSAAIGTSPTQKIQLYWNNVYIYRTNTFLASDTWYYIIISKNGSNYRIFYNGIETSLYAGGGGNYGSWVGISNTRLGLNSSFGLSSNSKISNFKVFNNYISNSSQANDLFEYALNCNNINNYSIDLDQNLVAYYKFNEASGTTIYDSAKGNNGTLTNGATINASGLWDSNALSLDGVNDYVLIPDNNNLDFVNKMTLSFWLKTDSGLRQHPISKTGNVSADKGYEIDLYFVSNEISLTISESDGAYVKVGGGVIPVGEWKHVVFTFDSDYVDQNHIKLFVDGLEQNVSVLQSGGSVNSIGVNDLDLIIGNRTVGVDRFFDGLIDEVKIYDKALTAEEILLDYNSFLNTKFVDANIIDAGSSINWNSIKINSDINYSFGNEICGAVDSDCSVDKFNDGLVGLWHLNGNANDSSGNGYNGIINNASITSGLWDTNAYFFNTDNTEYIDINNPILSGTTNFTITAWVYPSNLNNGITKPIIGNYSPTTNISGFSFRITASAGGPSLYYGSTSINSPISANENKWNFVVARRTGNTVAIFLNGNLVFSGTNSASIGNNNNIAIGRGINYTSQYFSGSIEEVAIWNRALTDEEVLDLYIKGANRLDLNVYSCSDASCNTKTSSQYINNVKNNFEHNISSLNNSRYLGFDTFFKKTSVFENNASMNFFTSAFIKDVNISSN